MNNPLTNCIQMPRIEKQAAFLCCILVIFAQLTLLAFGFPITEVLTSKPLFYIDSPYHWFEISQSHDLWADGHLVGYDPWFAAGYVDGINYNQSAKIQALLATAFSPWLSAMVAYKFFCFVSSLFAPACVPIAMRLLRTDTIAIVAATVLGLLLWWISALHWYHTAGMVSFVFCCYAALPYSVWLWNGITQTLSLCQTCLMGLVGAIGLFYHPLFPLPIVFSLAFMMVLSWEQVKLPQFLNVLVFVPMLSLLPNMAWIVPSLQHGSPTSSIPYQKLVDINLVWLEAIGRIDSHARGAKLNPVLWFFALAGIAGATERQLRRLSLSFVLAAAAMVLYAAVGAALPLVRDLQPNRMSIDAYLLLVVPAGIGMSALAKAYASRRFPWPLSAGAATAFVLVLAFFGREIAQELSRGDGPHYGGRPPEVQGIGDTSLWLLDWLDHNTDSSSRVLFETSHARIHDGAHMAGYYSLAAQREFIGGPYPFMHYAGFWDGFLFGRKISDFTHEEITKRLALYNIGWIVVHSAKSKEYFDRLPGIKLLIDQGVLKIYEFEGKHSYFLEGSGRVAGRGFNRVDLQDLSGETVTLSYHYVPGLVTVPSTKIEPVRQLDDPLPFVSIVNPPKAVTLHLP